MPRCANPHGPLLDTVLHSNAEQGGGRRQCCGTARRTNAVVRLKAKPHERTVRGGRQRRARRWALLLGAALALTGCASAFRLDSEVESFARWGGTGPAAALSAPPENRAVEKPVPSSPAASAVPTGPQAYVFDRLPSQQSGRATAQQKEMEDLAAQTLLPLGWTLATEGQSAPWSVQVQADMRPLAESRWPDRWAGLRPHAGLGWGVSSGRHGRVAIGGALAPWGWWAPYPEPLTYERALLVLIRRKADGQVVFETKATSDGYWNNSPRLWSGMLTAALAGFPQPPAGPREVRVDVPAAK